MNCLFIRRGYPETSTDITVTITGSGSSTYCYATIGGTKRYGEGTYTVQPGDTITFGVYGRSATYSGSVTIDGSQKLRVTDNSTKTYAWTVPSGISSITMSLTFDSPTTPRYGKIVVTTD